MRLFSRHYGRHTRHGSYSGWGGLAALVSVAAEHPVVDVAITRPALANPYPQEPTR
ncbi:hypothetical protein [Streptosporangium roseum]|uniref:hypothetical protein n=1 Tax=Streptosporangium roseum TaxID=2001 RepID=UPI00332CE96A